MSPVSNECITASTELATMIPDVQKRLVAQETMMHGNQPRWDVVHQPVDMSEPVCVLLLPDADSPTIMNPESRLRLNHSQGMADSDATHAHAFASSCLSHDSESCPSLDCSLSSASSAPSGSRRSSDSRQSDTSMALKKRGYVRPQATTFAPSAKNRESVMSLGSIAHLQYYFARTGLLDGKGAQLAGKVQLDKATSDSLSALSSLDYNSHLDNPTLSPTPTGFSFADSDFCMNVSNEQSEDANWDRELATLPPTVSTYNARTAYLPPPPDLSTLRRQLTEALEDTLKAIKELEHSKDTNHSPGWSEARGLHLLNVTTLTIRAARNYYTAHSQFQRLDAIKSERVIRQELYQVLEILNQMTTRKFAGGMLDCEKVGILTWIVGISEMIQAEIDEEKSEARECKKWAWRDGDWSGREREQEHAFIKCFMHDPEQLPDWTAPDEATPSPFLQYFQTGLRLVLLHNAIVQKSPRQFEEIKVLHTNVDRPYRCAENLRFWAKAAERRWDVLLKLDVMGIVQNSGHEPWLQFDRMLLKWCRGVREQFVKECTENKSPSAPAWSPMPNYTT